MVRFVLCALLPLTTNLVAQQSKRPFDVYTLQRVVRVSDPQLSPDGSQVAFAAERVFLTENRKEKHIWLVPVDGGEPRQITYQGEANGRPRWSPDGESIAYVSDRSGKSQVWLMSADGEETRQITHLSTGADGVLFSPAGDRLVFQSRVYSQCGGDDACNARELEAAENDPVQAVLYERLLYRHWDEWDDGRVSHLFSVSLTEANAAPVDLTPGPHDAPAFSLGGPDDYAISPDGNELCFVSKTVERPEISTDTNLYTVPITGGEAERITSNAAADVSPAYSPDGRYLAYRRQDRPGYESDRYRLIVLDRESGEARSLTDSIDRWVTSVVWAPNSSRLFFTTEDRGREPIFTARPDGSSAAHGRSTAMQSTGIIQIAPDGEVHRVYGAVRLAAQSEIYRSFATGGAPLQLTHFNDEILETYETVRAGRSRVDTASDGIKVGGFLVKPAGFDLQKRYPLLVLVHGGPQGAWGEAWSYRWNAQVFAGAGYVVFMPNPARLHRLRPTLHRRDPRRLGRQGLPRHPRRRRSCQLPGPTSTPPNSMRPGLATAAT